MTDNDPRPPGPWRVLVADDDDDFTRSIKDFLELGMGLHADTANDGDAALQRLLAEPYHLLLTDLLMPGRDGMQLLREIRERGLPVTVIVSTAVGSVERAVQAIKQGAYDYLTKPFTVQELRLVVERALRELALREEVHNLRQQLRDRFAFHHLLSKSPRMHAVFELIRKVARTSATVLIQGETGTGKEQVARTLHDHSAVRAGPFVAVNCAALPETMVESELFGHEPGAFATAPAGRRGRFEQAHGGTLLLDAVQDLPATVQARLLRVLEDGRLERVGGGEPVAVDVRIVAATTRDLARLVRRGGFREDLYYRLNVVRIELPPLRDRPEDIPLLAQHFAERFAVPGEPPRQFAPEAMEMLVHHRWPGNVRELENVVERACVTATGPVIAAWDLPDLLKRPKRRAATAPRPRPRPTKTRPADDHAFSALAVVTRYPAPVAVAYQRVWRQPDRGTRLLLLFRVAEAALRYLALLGLCDLFHCRGGDDPPGELPDHSAFDCLRRPKVMSMGHWLETLRETARHLAAYPDRFVKELPRVCKPDGRLVADLFPWLVQKRNEVAHANGVPLTEEETRALLDEARPKLETALQQIHFVCEYPLGFVQRSPADRRVAGRKHYFLHRCMGAHVANTAAAVVVETPVPLPPHTPFVVAPDGSRLLHLWPLVQERVAGHSGRHTLYLFEDLPDRRRPYLTEVRFAAIDLRDDWRLVLHDNPAADHAWLRQRQAALPLVLPVPASLGLADKLRPSACGKLVGQMLGEYRLTEVVGRGGFGTVYLAEGPGGGRFAVKVIEATDGVRHFARFQREFEKLHQAAGHPHILNCFDYGSEILDGWEYPWYSMEYAVGGDLGCRLDERHAAGRVPWDDPALREQVCGEFRAVAAAAAHLHQLDIVHRDIKPANVLILEDGTLRLGDFGLVKDLAPSEANFLTQSGTTGVVGTWRYMAPEQSKGLPVEKTADVYSLGVLLAELATGERPEPDRFVAQGSTLTDGRTLAGLPSPLARFILRCTDVEPARRPADGQAVLDAFAEAAASEDAPPGGTS